MRIPGHDWTDYDLVAAFDAGYARVPVYWCSPYCGRTYSRSSDRRAHRASCNGFTRYARELSDMGRACRPDDYPPYPDDIAASMTRKGLR